MVPAPSLSTKPIFLRFSDTIGLKGQTGYTVVVESTETEPFQISGTALMFFPLQIGVRLYYIFSNN